MPDPFPGGLSFEFNGQYLLGMRETPGPRDQKTKALEEVQGGGGERWGPGIVRGAAPLYLLPSLLGLGLPCIWGPSCSVGSVTSAVVMLMQGPHTGLPLHQPAHIGSWIPAPIPSGRGQSVGPEPSPRQQTPSQSEPAAKGTFQAQAVTFLSPKLQKRNEI